MSEESRGGPFSIVIALGSAVAGLVALALGIGVVATSSARDVLGVPETTIARTSYVKAGFLIVPESIKSLVAFPWLDAWHYPALSAALIVCVGCAVVSWTRNRRDTAAGILAFATLVATIWNGKQLLAVFDHTARNLLQPSTAPSAALGADMAEVLLKLLRGDGAARADLDHRYASLIAAIALLVASVLLLVREYPEWLDLRRVFGPTPSAPGHKKASAVKFSGPATATVATVAILGLELIGVPFAYGVMKLVQPPVCTQLTLTSSMAKYYGQIKDSVIGEKGEPTAPIGALLSDLSSDPDEIHLLTRNKVNNLYLHKFKRQDVVGFLFVGPRDCNAF